MSVSPDQLRPRWETFISPVGARSEELANRWRTAQQQIRDNEVTYNVYGDPLGTDRP